MKDVINQLIRLIKREPKTADQNPATSNLGITPEAIMSNIAFITKVKKPSVNMFMGRVMINKNGLRKAFSTPSMAAAKNAEKKPLTCIPSSRYDVTKIAIVRINHLTNIPFIIFSHQNH
jgi:hypothetical protein